MGATPAERYAALRDDERVAVTAEFAVALPAVLIVLGLIIGGVSLVTHRLTLTSAAADVSRLEARGDHDLAAARLEALAGPVEVERLETGGLLCVTLRAAPGLGLLRSLGISASACAARSGVAGDPA